ncbi:MAG: hypothetical protein QG611_571 [Bacteroidota bacterium]|nr:hypothetical protein [Bacteroidota bacterium]
MRFYFSIAALLIPLSILGQLTAPGSNAMRYTLYPSAPDLKDPVFIYCNSTGTQKGTIQADSPGGTAPYNFSWYKWSDLTKSFSIFLRTDAATGNSLYSDLDEGGYKVRITDGGGYDTTLVGWIFLDKPSVHGQVWDYKCQIIALTGTAAIDTFFYKDPSDGAAVRLINGYTTLWSSTPSSVIPYPTIIKTGRYFIQPPEDVIYKLQVVDSFQCSSESTFPFTSILVKADFSVDPATGGAPLEVTFTDKSIRGSKRYTWEFGDKTPEGQKMPPWVINKDSLWIFDSPFTHTYYKPGEYSVKLTIESDPGCIDSLRFDKIVVEPSSLSIPNVFTPDGDPYNDRFMIESKSMRSMSVEIFSQSGLKVYGFKGEGARLKEWTGWDGTINNTSIKASPGVYFYIIRAYGWDDVRYDSKAYRGFVYLYR